jgi:tRNA (guanosine-2'-O-)-methyltransferase
MTNKLRTNRIDDILLRKQPSLQLFLDNVHNSQNLSAILRSCDGVGVLDLYYSTVNDKDLRIHKTITQGAHHWVNRHRIVQNERCQFLKKKQEEGFQIVVTHFSDKAVSFREINYTRPTVIVMGNEKEGVSEEVIALADVLVMVPMMGMVQSLNVSVATALILYEAERQLENAGRYDIPQLSKEQREKIKNDWLYRDMIARRSKGKIPL